MENLLKFNSIEWENPKPGLKQKTFSEGKTQMRLLRFEEDFVEEDWCHKGHMGFVVEGEMKLHFEDKIEYYQKGDGLWILPGKIFKHKVIIDRGRFVELIVFELEL